MKGGYQIIDIRKLNLTLSNTSHSITDAEILEQLKSLRVYIEKGHDFTKPLDNALKCIQIRYRDAKNGEKLEACNWANIEVSNNSLTFVIKSQKLMIEVVFEEKTDEYENKYYDIKTAKYIYSNEIDIEGFTTFESDVDIKGDLTVEGNATFDETHFEDSAYIFENIVDADGHKRFVEGNGGNIASAIDSAFSKWALSGSHLIFVLAGKVKANETINAFAEMVRFTLPEWIMNKIYPVLDAFIEDKEILYVNSSYQTANEHCSLNKKTGYISIDNGLEAIAPTSDYFFRISFDLLIDNESEE